MPAWFPWLSPNRTPMHGQAFVDLVSGGPLPDIQAQLKLGADPNEAVTGWMEVVTPVGASVDRGELAITLALLQAGGQVTQGSILESIVRQRPDWIPSLARFVPADDAHVNRIAALGAEALDRFSLHWDRGARQRLLAAHAGALPHTLAAERDEHAQSIDHPRAPRRPRRRA